jgi:uncharacterized protein YbaR (Trm112 family)
MRLPAMRATLLEHLVCPDCLGALTLNAETVEGDWIDSGTLRCDTCKRSWPIEQGVPNFVAAADRSDVQQTTSGFARNWDEFNQVINSHKALNDELFRDWILPLDPECMRGKTVLEAGCGMGRWLWVASTYQPKALIGVDYSAIAYTAARNLRELPNAHIVRADILHMPLRREMELTYCLGVVHHTPEPGRTFDALVSKMADGGAMTVWVYGKEGNGWIHNVVTPLREKVTSKLPHPVLAGLSKMLAFQLYGAAAAYKLGLEKMGFPYAAYLAYLRRYPFKYMEHIVYDHLVPQIAHYHGRDELVTWAERNGLFYKLSPRNGNSWRLLVSRDRDLVPEAETPRAAAAR